METNRHVQELPAAVRASALTRAEQRRAAVFCFEGDGRWVYARRPPEDGRSYWVLSPINRNGSWYPARHVPEAPVPSCPPPPTTPELHPNAAAVSRAVRSAIVRAVSMGRDSAAGFQALYADVAGQLERARREIARLQNENDRLRAGKESPDAASH